ncbi:FAD-binding protein [Paraburkholderia oxyphila]|uniref:FAD-binding protein n=1 Tax=Paraburkholderia oxyphila TaxID=614212 RepID=UPI00048226D7|nr:FAD-binding protein [Paraburkholderia oxyphila]
MNRTTAQIWQNWAGNVTGTPAAIFTPRTQDDIKEIIQQARRENKKVRVAGSGHSWGPLVPTDGYLIRLQHFADVSINAGKTIVTLGPAVTVDQLAQFFLDHDVCVPSSVGIGLGEATMGGVFSTGCHGSGIEMPSVSDWIVGVELIDANGEVRTYSQDKDGVRVMNMLRLSLGMCGVITAFQIRVQPMFNVHVVESKESVASTLAGLKELVMGNAYAEVSWMPFNDQIWVQKANVTDLPITRDGFTPPANPFRDKLYAAGSALALDALETTPEMTPDILRTSFQMLDPGNYVSKITHYLHCADYGFLLDRYRLLDIEVVFEIDKSFDTVRRAFAIAAEKVEEWQKNGKYPLNSTLGFRFIKNSDATLSSCRGNAYTCMAEIFSYHKTDEWAIFAGELVHAWMKELPRARLHWAKAFQYVPDTVAAIREAFGSQMTEFLEIRREIGVDPDDLFVNDVLAELFGLAARADGGR